MVWRCVELMFEHCFEPARTEWEPLDQSAEVRVSDSSMRRGRGLAGLASAGIEAGLARDPPAALEQRVAQLEGQVDEMKTAALLTARRRGIIWVKLSAAALCFWLASTMTIADVVKYECANRTSTGGATEEEDAQGAFAALAAFGWRVCAGLCWQAQPCWSAHGAQAEGATSWAIYAACPSRRPAAAG